ncbi:MAG: DNA repair protein RecN [Parachlamydiaceae bacterium]|nr:DNA repair protein RecN [Parachlamydiaceae bacterium]
MLKRLFIQNIILVEQANLIFNSGLSILTGETGSGKSAIMQSISLIAGERADTSILRKGCDKGIVEAIFDCSNSLIVNILNESGIEHEDDQELIIRRELNANGKGRIYINQQQVQLSFLKKLGSHLVHLVGQKASHRLFSIDYHREVLDLYGQLDEVLKEFQSQYHLELACQKQLDFLIHQEGERLREIDRYQHELEELSEAQIKEGEDEALFAEYSFLINSEEMSSKVNEINLAFTGERQSVLAILNRQKQVLKDLTQLDSSLEETFQSFQNALLELHEISHTLLRYQEEIDHSPDRLHLINERLTLINQIKKKYGPTVSDILNYQQMIKDKLYNLENRELEIELLTEKLAGYKKQNLMMIEILSDKRKKAAAKLEKELTKELQALNMPNARFKILIEEVKRTENGHDRVEFILSPNQGEHEISLKDHASGGEVSRVLLALQTVLADKEQKSTLIFDEVDGNIGGETATIVGRKLRQIAENHQVICITHFAQVANQADFHLQIIKQDKDGRTVTLVNELNDQSRELELERMAGGKLSFAQLEK